MIHFMKFDKILISLSLFSSFIHSENIYLGPVSWQYNLCSRDSYEDKGDKVFRNLRYN